VAQRLGISIRIHVGGSDTAAVFGEETKEENRSERTGPVGAGGWRGDHLCTSIRISISVRW